MFNSFIISIISLVSIIIADVVVIVCDNVIPEI